MSFPQLITLSLAAVLAESLVSSKLPGTHTVVYASKKMNSAVIMGLTVLFVMTAASVCTGVVNQFLLRYNVPALYTVVFIIFAAAIIQIGEFILKKAVPAIYASAIAYLPLLLVNIAVMSVSVGITGIKPGFLSPVTAAAAAGAAFCIAIVLFASIRERLNFSDYPDSFKGFPIALITAALLSIAFFGFHGVRI
jgi:electron transport complex protein RnfA